jgi:Hemerythrin HHE cation binding domain
MKGPLHEFFAADHRRLDGLLKASMADPGRIDLGPFGAFRAGLLKHIGMEEKVLFPMARRARGETYTILARVRVDHGAIAALLVPTPTPAIVGQIVSLLGAHNRREEEEGVYDACDAAVDPAEAERVLHQLRVFPDVPLKAYNDGPEVMKHIEVTLEMAQRQWRQGGAL